MCFVCLLGNQHTVFKWKDAISGFPVSQGSAEPLDRWGGKTKHRLIFYFLSNTSAKNYRNPVVYIKIIASQRWDFFETQCKCIINNSLWLDTNYLKDWGLDPVQGSHGSWKVLKNDKKWGPEKSWNWVFILKKCWYLNTMVPKSQLGQHISCAAVVSYILVCHHWRSVGLL